MKRKSVKRYIRLTGVLLIGVFIVLSIRYFRHENFLKETKEFFIDNPIILLIVTISYLFSFILRAEAWRLYLGNNVRFFSCLQGVLLSLFVNHITPIKVGDAIRIGVLSWREKNIKPEISAHSVIVLRVLDMFFLLLFSFIGLIALSRSFTFRYSLPMALILLVFGLIGFLILSKFRPPFLEKHIQLIKTSIASRNFTWIIILVALSWILEGAVVWGVTSSLGNGLPIYKAIWVNSITVGGQVFQITPGGISTYEAVMTAALSSFHYPVKDGYMVALVSHSYKFIFSYFVGFLLLIHSPRTKINQIREILLMRRRPE
ncbi:lysylphosphatidylglycerol synthase transmembrane domain-containing protein [Neobacillus drentensis]|uniref:lysylphosphatidylglycerol synthase transmembrane domain-containing protein n=1 Tax=Neobacillus drentensis TaxID=220684 RepID=UPI003002D3CD